MDPQNAVYPYKEQDGAVSTGTDLRTYTAIQIVSGMAANMHIAQPNMMKYWSLRSQLSMQMP